MIINVENEMQIEIVVSLAKEIWTEYFTRIIGKEQVDYMLNKFQSKKAITDQLKVEGYNYYLIKDYGEYLGYMAVKLLDNELFLSKIYIKASYRKKGYGRYAIEYLEDISRLKSKDKISLTVYKNNVQAIKAYEKLGFINAGSTYKKIGNGFVMDDFKMEKPIPEL